MPDREKIIYDIERCICHVPDACRDCSHYGHGEVIGCMEELLKDTLNLLKEQQPKTGHWIVLEYCANEGIYCSECNTKIFDRITKPKYKLSRYCPHCGSRNEQFFRDGEVVFR